MQRWVKALRRLPVWIGLASPLVFAFTRSMITVPGHTPTLPATGCHHEQGRAGHDEIRGFGYRPGGEGEVADRLSRGSASGGAREANQGRGTAENADEIRGIASTKNLARG